MSTKPLCRGAARPYAPQPFATWALVWLLGCAALAGCQPLQCKRTAIVIERHPTKPRPAGKVTVGCDGKAVDEIVADEVVW